MFGQINHIMMVCGMKIKWVDLVNSVGQMVGHILVNG